MNASCDMCDSKQHSKIASTTYVAKGMLVMTKGVSRPSSQNRLGALTLKRSRRDPERDKRSMSSKVRSVGGGKQSMSF